MDDPSLLPFLNNNGNGHHYSIDEEIEHEEDELDDEDDLQDYDQHQQYPEDEIDEDEVEEDEIDDEEDNQDEQEILIPPPPPAPEQQIIQSERGGRRKGVPRRLQLSPQIIKGPAPQQRLLPLSLPKSSTSVHHHDQPILTSDQEDENGEDLNNENHSEEYFDQHQDNKQPNCIQLDLLSRHLIEEQYDENNNSYNDEENILEIVDDLLADIVTTIVRDIREQRQRNFKQRMSNGKTNGYLTHKSQTNGLTKSIQKQERKITNGKNNTNGFMQTNR
jgi:hypothetical protein